MIPSNDTHSGGESQRLAMCGCLGRTVLASRIPGNRNGGGARAWARGSGFLVGLFLVCFGWGCTRWEVGSGGGEAGRPVPTTSVTGVRSMLRGNIQIDGSSTVKPIGEAVAKRFGRIHPRVRVDVGGRGTGNGLKRFQSREIDFVHASRPVLPSEALSLQAALVEYLELPVAYDGVTVVVHPDNHWVNRLDLEQLKRIFLQSKHCVTWRDVDPSWPDQPLKVFAPGTGSGTYDYFREVMGGDLRSGMSLNEDDNALVNGVSGNRYSIGFFGVAYFNENREKLKAVPIVNPEDGLAYLPDSESIENRSYQPLSRPLFLYVNGQSLTRVEVRTYLKHYIEAVPEMVENVGFVRLPNDIWESVREAVESPDRHLGTRFVDARGERRVGSFEDIFLGAEFFPESTAPVLTPTDLR